MKNPLVDALRQANDQAAPPAPATVPATVTGNELQLLDSLVMDPAARTANDDLDAGFAATASLQLADDDDDMQIVTHAQADAATAHKITRTTTARPPGSSVAKLGSYSPLLCCALFAVASGTYFAYQALGGQLQNVDLQVISTQVDTSGRVVDSAATGSELFSNPFPLIVGAVSAPQSSMPRDDAARSSASRGGATNRDTDKVLTQPAKNELSDRALAALHGAYRAFEAGDFVAAESAYRDALRLAPLHPNALQGLAAVLRRNGKTAESLQVFEQLLSVEPNNTAATAALLMGQGDSPAADSEIKFLIQRHPESASLNFALGIVYAEQSRWVDAGHYFSQAAALDATNADYLFNVGVSLERLNRYDEASAYYAAALQAGTASSAVQSATLHARIAELAALPGAAGRRQ